MSKYRTAYAREFHQQLIVLVHAGCGANDVAKEFGLHAATVAKWVRLSQWACQRQCRLSKVNFRRGRRILPIVKSWSNCGAGCVRSR